MMEKNYIILIGMENDSGGISERIMTEGDINNQECDDMLLIFSSIEKAQALIDYLCSEEFEHDNSNQKKREFDKFRITYLKDHVILDSSKNYVDFI